MVVSAGSPFLVLLATVLVAGVVFSLLHVMSRRGLTLSSSLEEPSANAENHRGRRASIGGPLERRTRACTNPLCEHENRPAARFCAQCGKRLA